MISYHLNKSFHPDHYGQGFRTADTPDLRRIARGISSFVWSPVIWEGGVRQQTNFLYAYYAVLDFDNGATTLDEAKKSFCDVNHIIGTTRSHQLEKRGATCDRFRVLLELAYPLIDLRSYRYNMSTLIRRYGTDRSCLDGARYFFPCREVVSLVVDGDRWPVASTPDEFENVEARAAGEKLARLEWTRYQRLPGWTNKFLKYGQPFDGKGREVSAFMVASQMRLAGISENEAYSLLLKSPFDRTDFSAERELKHAVRSAYKK